MTSLTRCFLTLVLGTWMVPGAFPRAPRKLATVTLRVLDSFGQAREGCHLLEFVRLEDAANLDYKSRFDGLVGRDIPYAHGYRVHVKCTDERVGGPFFVSVSRSDQFVVLSYWPHLGDYYTGLEPRLTVSVSAQSGAGRLEQAWVKVIGVYVDSWESDSVDPQSHAARFYDVEPARCLVLLLAGDKLACAKQIDILGDKARLDLSLSEHGCKAEGLSSVKVID